MNQLDECPVDDMQDADANPTDPPRDVCRLDRHLFIFFFFLGLFSWPVLTILEGTSNLFDFLYLIIVWIILILLLFRIRKTSLKCLDTTPGQGK